MPEIEPTEGDDDSVIRDPAVQRRMGLAFELYQLAEEMVRQNYRRRHPAAGEAEVQLAVRRWVQTRPGAEHGDGVGTPRPRRETGGSSRRNPE